MRSLRDELIEIAKDAAAQVFVNGYTLDDFEVDWHFATRAEKDDYIDRFDAPFGTQASQIQIAATIFGGIEFLRRRYLDALLVADREIALELEALLRKRQRSSEALAVVLASIETMGTDADELAARRAARAQEKRT